MNSREEHLPEWDDDFHGLLLEVVAPEYHDSIEPMVDFVGIGVDSMASVQLLVALENMYQIVFPPEYLDAETLASPSALWGVVTLLRSAPA